MPLDPYAPPRSAVVSADATLSNTRKIAAYVAIVNAIFLIVAGAAWVWRHGLPF